LRSSRFGRVREATRKAILGIRGLGAREAKARVAEMAKTKKPAEKRGKGKRRR